MAWEVPQLEEPPGDLPPELRLGIAFCGGCMEGGGVSSRRWLDGLRTARGRGLLNEIGGLLRGAFDTQHGQAYGNGHGAKRLHGKGHRASTLTRKGRTTDPECSANRINSETADVRPQAALIAD